MSTAQKLVVGLIAIGLVTTVVLPKRQTPGVVTALASGGSNLFSTVMGTSVPAGAQKA